MEISFVKLTEGKNKEITILVEIEFQNSRK